MTIYSGDGSETDIREPSNPTLSGVGLGRKEGVGTGLEDAGGLT
jgi:hypothetical protein